MMNSMVHLTVPIYIYMRAVAGNWNAGSGAADMQILGKFAVGPMCANVDSLVNFISTNHFVVSSTDFHQPQRQFEA